MRQPLCFLSPNSCVKPFLVNVCAKTDVLIEKNTQKYGLYPSLTFPSQTDKWHFQFTFGILLDIGRVLLSLECFGSIREYPTFFSLAKCFTQNFIHHPLFNVFVFPSFL
jgi:hypothetical protein